MPSSTFSGTVSSPKLSVAVDMGNPFLNLTVDGFLKIGAVGVTKSLVEDTYKAIDKGSVNEGPLLSIPPAIVSQPSLLQFYFSFLTSV
ncbi:hypothetical protein F2Q69_00012102 [Brassica cretica]|uniref:Uncharacterized protein n=1 Tax=Brassica cretica TaxID=69181 RepID=A0A8S9QJ80_BRACR|nr:hypothetical protein F2Q69_00012102 [Brassica cretica]